MLQLPNINKSAQKLECSKLDVSKKNIIKPYDYFQTRVPKSQIENLVKSVKDERFLFFIKYGTLRRFEGECDLIYVEIPQIPKKLVVYRRPYCRMKCIDKLNLSKKDLPHIPLFEGEDHLKYLSLELNRITKIDQLISLNNLIYLNLYGNHIKEIENLSHTSKLRVLLLGKNCIEKIKNLNSLTELEILDLHSNKIKVIENLTSNKKLRVINLANNLIQSLNELIINKNLEELNIRKNGISSIPELGINFEKLKKINIGKNNISRVEYIQEFIKLKHLEEIIIESNPVLNNPDIIDCLNRLPVKGKEIMNFPKNYHCENGSNYGNLDISCNGTKYLIKPSQKGIISEFDSLNERNSVEKTVENKTGSSKNLLGFTKVNGNKFNGLLSVGNELTSKVKNNRNYISDKDSLEMGSFECTQNFDTKIIPIQKLWLYEYSNIINQGYNGYNHKKYRVINIDQGHVEIENDSKLILYGNCLKILTKEEFYSKIIDLSFNFFCFDFIMSKKMIEYIKEFKGLKYISFSDNNIFSFYQLTKLENFDSIERLTITNNEICCSKLMPHFLLYRINNLKYLNGIQVNENDKIAARKMFQYFDKVISIKEKEAFDKAKDQEKDNLNNSVANSSTNDASTTNEIKNGNVFRSQSIPNQNMLTKNNTAKTSDIKNLNGLGTKSNKINTNNKVNSNKKIPKDMKACFIEQFEFYKFAKNHLQYVLNSIFLEKEEKEDMEITTCNNNNI